MKRNFTLVAGVAGVLIVAAAIVGLRWQTWADELPEDAAFSIGDHVVTVAELDRRNDSLRALYGVQEPLEKDQGDTFRRQAAKSMAIGMVLDDAVEEYEIEVTDGEVDQAMDAYLAAQFDGDQAAFLAAVGNVGTSEVAVRDEIRRQLALRRLLPEVAGDVVISDADLGAAFEERRAKLGSPQKRKVSNIVVGSKRDARLVRQRLDAGEPVAALAGAVSIDGATRAQGGRLGAVAEDELVPAVGAAVFSVRSGQTYGPVKGPNGWNVGVVTEIIPPVKAELGAVADDLRTSLVAEEEQRRWTKWLEKRLREADIDYVDDYRPEAPYDVSTWDDQPALGGEIQHGEE